MMRTALLRSLALVACTGGTDDPTDTDSTDPTDTTDTTDTTTDTTDTGDTGPDPDSIFALGVITGWDGTSFAYADRVEPYTLATPLFSDYAVKERAYLLPEGQQAIYRDPAVLDFPVGTTIVKSFLFPADLRTPDQDLRVIETRVLIREENGWQNWPYLWNEEQTDAIRAPSGAIVQMEVTGFDGEPLAFPYLVPQRNQCVDCHELTGEDGRYTTPIGPSVRNLNVGDQMARLAGTISGLPPLGELPAAYDASLLAGVDPTTLDDPTLEAAARDYLHVNCAHCHNRNGTEGVSSQLFLTWYEDDPFHLGQCKKPGSAGRGTNGLDYDIVPGDPESSILWYRTQTEEIGEMMPDIGRSLRHDEGVALIAEWIRRLEGTCTEN